MAILRVQLPHPGRQKPFNLSLKGFRTIGGRIIRDWNSDPNHYRKFLKNKGEYIEDINDKSPKTADLFFWGEWEGNSIFTPLSSVGKPDYRILPNGVHEPFHSIKIRGDQNTDPYVFGENFKYCVCWQSGEMEKLSPNSLLIFGSLVTNLGKFYVDTVFVVKDHETSTSVRATGAVAYSHTYKEETLEQLNEYFKVPLNVNNKKLYRSQTWWDNKEYFSFVPCKSNHDVNGFERLFIDINDPIIRPSELARNRTFFSKCSLSPQELWEKIAGIAVKQGFQLGIRFEEPVYSNVLDQLSTQEMKTS